MNRPEIIALIVIALTLFLLVKYAGVQVWQMLLILIAGLALSAYVPQIPHLVAIVTGWLTSHVTSFIHH